MICMTPGRWGVGWFGTKTALLVVGFFSASLCVLSRVAGVPLSPVALASPSFLIIRGLMGCTTAPLHPGGARVASQWIPFGQRALANGLITGAAPVGVASVHVVFGTLVDSVGWRLAFWTTGLCTALIALVWR